MPHGAILLLAGSAPVEIVLGAVLQHGGRPVTTASSWSEASGLLEKSSFQILMVDPDLCGPDGLSDAVGQLGPDRIVLLVDRDRDTTGFRQLGISRWVRKPIQLFDGLYAMLDSVPPGEAT